MKMKAKLPILTLVLCLTNFIAYSQFENLKSYDEAELLAIEFGQANKFDSVILLLEYSRDKFPEKDERATIILDQFYTLTQQNDKLLENWNYGLNKRYFFGIDEWSYEQLRSDSEFKRLLQLDRQLGDSLSGLAKMEFEVSVPINYKETEVYPILFAFHGNNETLESVKEGLTSGVLKEKFIVVYLQSYIYMSQFGFQWRNDDERTDKELKAIYNNVLNEYSVDKNKIVFLGSSAGGSQAIQYSFNQLFPVSDLILNCPVIPELEETSLNAFVKRNNKIAIVTGEHDWALQNQENLIHKIDSLGGNSKLTVNANQGHQCFAIFSNSLDEYLNWILD